MIATGLKKKISAVFIKNSFELHLNCIYIHFVFFQESEYLNVLPSIYIF